MGNNYPSTSIIPPGRKKMEQAIPSTTILPNTEGPRQRLGGFASTSTTFPLEDTRTTIAANYKVVLSDHKGFEEVILENVETRKEAYDAYRAWLVEFNADPTMRNYPPDTWAICTRDGELSWKTNPFIG